MFGLGIFDRFQRWRYGRHLTKAGWPRPRVAGKPIPWDAPAIALGKVHPDRSELAHNELLCTVCGLPHGRLVWFLIDEQPPENRDDTLSVPMSDELLHERCMRLALAHCPTLRKQTPLWSCYASLDAVEVIDAPNGSSFDRSGRVFAISGEQTTIATRIH